MRIEALTKIKETDAETGIHYVLGAGDVSTVSDPFGQHLCDRGWAKDMDGLYASAPTVPGAATVAPQKATHARARKSK